MPNARRSEIFSKIAKKIRETITILQTKETSESFGKLHVIFQRFRANRDISDVFGAFAFSLKLVELGKGSGCVNKQAELLMEITSAAKRRVLTCSRIQRRRAKS